ncbi:hypothetical protein [Actinomadura sediminis]|uniref:Chromosome segregation protein SMC n=1 Tax=Actinomadura sediminis TaxID=1038904 RepID=A0ABW3EPU0_9ACTN
MSEIDRLTALGSVDAILDELQQRRTEWDDAREALDALISAGWKPEPTATPAGGVESVVSSGPLSDEQLAEIREELDLGTGLLSEETVLALLAEVKRLRSQLGMHLTAWRNARQRARIATAREGYWRGRAETHEAALKAADAERDRIAELRDAAMRELARERTALDQAAGELKQAEAERDRLAEQARQARWLAAEMHEFNSPEGEHLPDCPGCRIERALDGEPGA